MKWPEPMRHEFCQRLLGRKGCTCGAEAANSMLEACRKAWEESNKENHCKDCCCAQSWEALGVKEYTGLSIVEHIKDLKGKIFELEGGFGEQPPALVALNKEDFPIAAIQRICNVGVAKAMEVRDLVCSTFGAEKELVALDEELLEEFLVKAEDAYIHNNPLSLNRRQFLIKNLIKNFGTPPVQNGVTVALEKIVEYLQSKQRKHNCPGFDCNICSVTVEELRENLNA